MLLWAVAALAGPANDVVRPLSLPDCFRIVLEHNFEVVQLQYDLITARLNELAAVAQDNQALAQLALNEGTTLERDKLELQVK